MRDSSIIRILLAEDHIIVREGTRELLQREPDIEVVGEASDGEESVRLAEELKPDVVIMDIAMPKLNGIDATKKIKSILPTTAVLVLTAYDTEQYIMALLEAGAAGYLLKNVRGNQLVDAVRAVHSGESVLEPSATRQIINRLTSKASRQEEAMVSNPLTEREYEILRLTARGVSNKDIADILCLSIRTVQSHLSNIFKKLAVGSRTEAILYGLRRGWLTIEELP